MKNVLSIEQLKEEERNALKSFLGELPKKATKFALAAGVGLVLLSGAVTEVAASSNVSRGLHPTSLMSLRGGSAWTEVRPDSVNGVRGIRAQAELSTGARTNWAERLQTNNLPSHARVTTTTVSVNTNNAVVLIGTHRYMRQGESTWRNGGVTTHTFPAR